MAQTLVLVRHGSPEATAASGSDFDRRLTPSGARALRCAYPRTFALLGDDVEATVWSSPALRALETADVVAEAVGAEGIECHDSLYAQDQARFWEELAACDAPVLVVVGHAPFMDQLAARLVGAGGAVPPFGKGAAAAFSLPNGTEGAAALRWFVAGPEDASWEGLAAVEGEVAAAAAELTERAEAFLATPEDAQALLAFRVSVRRVRSLLQFLAPWQAKKQNRRLVHVLKEFQEASSRLRALDILISSVSGLVEGGELGENSLLPMACAKERSLECASLITLMRKHHMGKELKKLASDLEHLRWKERVAEKGLSAEDFRARFDEEFAEVDEGLFGLDLRDASAVFAARRDAKEVHYVAERLGVVLGPERAQMSEYLDEIQSELGALSDAQRNHNLAKECAKSPRFRGVRADLGVVARDQAEVVSAITSGLERMEVGALGEKDEDAAPADADAGEAEAPDAPEPVAPADAVAAAPTEDEDGEERA